MAKKKIKIQQPTYEKPLKDNDIKEIWSDITSSTTKRKKTKTTTPYTNNAKVDSIVMPLSGQSYNPDPELHDRLLNYATAKALDNLVEHHQKEVNLKQHQNITRALYSDTYPPVDKTMIEEADSDSTTVCDEDSLVLGEIKPKISKRLTKQQEMKRERRNLMKQEEKKKKALNRVKRIEEQAKYSQKISKKTTKDYTPKKLSKVEQIITKPKRSGKDKYEDDDIDIGFEEVGTLRNIQPSNNLVRSTFTNFQRRGLIEPKKLKLYQRRYQLKTKLKIGS
eukprot:TRINITY_DN2586_c0_g1_i1.p1 TRINITY_DN2586_c0_g1~~TRINITY_DN2586_c0_g1_i1.p1  ORF type:complete len:279 (+),score=76.85 TRINITY_DN2586_c0_g1_i1:29-865(+)